MTPPKIPYPIRTKGDLRAQLTQNLVGRSLRSLSDAGVRRKEAFDSGDWKAYRASIRQHIREVLGPMPFGKDGCPLGTRQVTTYSTRHCRIENVLFQSFPGWEVNASVFIPHGAGPFPAVVIPVGHSGKHYENYQIPAQAFASLGFVAVLFDPPGQDSEKKPGNDHFRDGVRTFLTGCSSQRYFVLDALRCIDYLETRQDADLSHGVGMTGVSGGGQTTLFATLFDARIACQGPSCCICRMADHPVGDAYAMCPESMWPGRIAAGVDEIDLLLAGIPTPTLYMAGKQDEVFQIAWSRALAQESEACFALSGAADRFRFFEDDGGHAYSLAQVAQFAAWMNRWIRAEPERSVPLLNPDEYAMLEYDMLRCRPAPEENMFTMNRALARDLKTRRDPHPDREALRQAVGRVIGAPTHPGTWVESEPFQLWAQHYHEVLFTTEALEIPATLLRPLGRSLSDAGKWIVYLDDHGRRNALESWGSAAQLSNMFERDSGVPLPTVLAPDLPGWGDSLPSLTPYSLSGWGSADRWSAYLSCALGDGVLAIQARSAASLVNHLIREENVDPGDLILVGRGLGGIVALLSGALGEGIGAIVSWSSLGCFQFLAEEEIVAWPSAA
ncbi:MAG: hypothetical protein V1800_07255, partial [Candidatus Latescibacterota bacterium]